MNTQLRNTFSRFAITTANAIGNTRCMACNVCRNALKSWNGKSPAMDQRTYAAASGMIASGCLSNVSIRSAGHNKSAAKIAESTARITPRCTPRRMASSSRAPRACATTGSRLIKSPIPKMMMEKKYSEPTAPAASASDDTRPSITVSMVPWSIKPRLTTTMGAAIRAISRSSPDVGTSRARAIMLLPLDGGRGLGAHVVHDAIDPRDLVDDAVRDARHHLRREVIPIGRHAIA